MTAIVNPLPQTGHLEIDIKVSADINISAYAAKQKVSEYVLSNISYMLHAGEAQLILTERIYWRILIILSLTRYGDVGEVGIIDVDAETGQMQLSPQHLKEIETRAENLTLSTQQTTT